MKFNTIELRSTKSDTRARCGRDGCFRRSIAGYRTYMATQRTCSPATALDALDRSAAATLYKALGDPHRLTILATLTKADEVCVCDFTSALPLNQPTVSHHLRVLREAGLIVSERRGTWVYYRLAPDALARVDATTRTLLAPRAAAAV